MSKKKTKKAPKTTKKKVDVWEFTEHHYPIRIYFSPDRKNWGDLLKFLDLEEEPYPHMHSGQVTEFKHPDRALTDCILTLGDAAEKSPATQVMGVIVHECIHIKQFVENAMFGNNSGRGRGRLDIESEAYFMQQLTQWVNTTFGNSGRKCIP